MTEAIIKKISELAKNKNPLLVAIDGRCASGKTTLAAELKNRIGCHVVHMDDFFLQPSQRTEQRLSQPGGNLDRERLLSEVLLPISRGEAAQYRPFRCHSGVFDDPVSVSNNGVILFEGSYSCHPELEKFYDLKIFLTVSPDEQLKRLEIRNPERLDAFKSRWIPLEEKYFSHFDIQSTCDIVFNTDK